MSWQRSFAYTDICHRVRSNAHHVLVYPNSRMVHARGGCDSCIFCTVPKMPCKRTRCFLSFVTSTSGSERFRSGGGQFISTQMTLCHRLEGYICAFWDGTSIYSYTVRRTYSRIWSSRLLSADYALLYLTYTACDGSVVTWAVVRFPASKYKRRMFCALG